MNAAPEVQGRWVIDLLAWFIPQWAAWQRTGEAIPYDDAVFYDAPPPPGLISMAADCFGRAADLVRWCGDAWQLHPATKPAHLSRVLRMARDCLQQDDFEYEVLDLQPLRQLKLTLEDAVPPLKSGEREDEPPTEILNRLTDRQRLVLQVLFQERAFDRDSRMRTSDIAEKAEGRGANPDNFKKSISELSQDMSLLSSLQGREGGLWLTDKGKRLAVIITTPENSDS